MEDSIQVAGKLSPEARKFFMRVPDPMQRHYPRALWSYEWLIRDDVLVQVADFTDRFVFATMRDLQRLQAKGIRTDRWTAIDLSSRDDIQVVSFSDDELKALTNAIRQRFGEF